MTTGTFMRAETREATIRWRIFAERSISVTARPTAWKNWQSKAQLAYYEDVRAQYEAYATHWSNRKMVMHWMMNSPWPSFFGHLFDYYFKQGGGYFGAKKAMRPVSVVWDYYATADRSTAHVYAVNQTAEPLRHVTVSVAFYNARWNPQVCE